MSNYMTKFYISVKNNIDNFFKDQRGVTAIEYSLIGVAMATLLAFILGDQNSGFLGELKKAFDAIATAISSVTISKK